MSERAEQPGEKGPPCWKCDGTGCENNCGRTGGCKYAYAGPDSHRICNLCHGTGWLVSEPFMAGDPPTFSVTVEVPDA